jgi:hypothetical protein
MGIVKILAMNKPNIMPSLFSLHSIDLPNKTFAEMVVERRNSFIEDNR